jgi:ClpP class serine protease
MTNHPHILKAIQAELWAIAPEALQQIIAIAQGYGNVDALAAKLGQPLTTSRTVTVRDGVAIVPVIGPLFRYANMFTEISGATSIQQLALDFQAAVDDPSVNAIILEIDSPGGQVSGISEFAAQIRQASAFKPVKAYVSDLAASAGYWLASAADSIIVNNTARLGSIGVVMQTTIDEADNSIKFISSQSPNKQADPSSDSGKLQYQKMVNDLAEVFINTVADYRGVTREEVIANFGMGGVMIAEEAINAGMADSFGSLEFLISALSNGRTYLPQSRGLLTMNKITKETLAAEAPDLLKAITDDAFNAGMSVGKAEGYALGAEAERQRIQAIDGLDTFGHDDLIAAAKFDGKSTAGDIAILINAAEKTHRAEMAAKITADIPKPVPHAQAAFNDGNGDSVEQLTGEDKWTHDWKHSAAIQSEFNNISAYVAYQKANEKGLIKTLGAK